MYKKTVYFYAQVFLLPFFVFIAVKPPVSLVSFVIKGFTLPFNKVGCTQL